MRSPLGYRQGFGLALVPRTLPLGGVAELGRADQRGVRVTLADATATGRRPAVAVVVAPAVLLQQLPPRDAGTVPAGLVGGVQALYRGRAGLSRGLTRRLRTGRPLRKRRRRPEQRTPRFVAPAKLIHHRPAVVETRARVGDWEGDLILGRQSRSAVATLVDRASRLTKLVHLPRDHSAETVRDVLRDVLGALPAAVRLTLTWDQGSEMAHHDQLTALLADGVFFANPASPWRRGSNENTNGLLRQYLPKGTDLSIHTADELRAIEDRLNNRPRKVLAWRTPDAVFHLALAP